MLIAQCSLSSLYRSGRRQIRSASDRRCFVPRTQNTFGDRFCVAEPRVRNRLPGCIRSELSEDISTDNLDSSWNHFCLGTVRPLRFVTIFSMALTLLESLCTSIWYPIIIFIILLDVLPSHSSFLKPCNQSLLFLFVQLSSVYCLASRAP